MRSPCPDGPANYRRFGHRGECHLDDRQRTRLRRVSRYPVRYEREEAVWKEPRSENEPDVGRSVADVFISYSRTDTEFVQRLASSLHELGKSTWIDTSGIADAEVFPQAIRTAIEESDAFLFVITPASVASRFCEQEVTYARTLAKRIVPVLRDAVPDEEIPEEIRNRNWIPFTDSDDYDSSLARVVQALDTDLELRREHTRILVKALEWDHEGKERSFLLRGAELKAAEGWLARTGPGVDQASTEVQRDYVLASRRAATRRGRVLVGVSVAIAVIALGLGVLALLSRNQAVSSSEGSRALALAAESQNDLSTDPEVSVIVAQEAVSLKPIPQALAALRQAMDASALRVALPSVAPQQCGFQSGPSIAYSPSGTRVAETLCTGELVVMDSANGRVLLRRHVAAQASAVAYEPNGQLLAIGTNRGIEFVDPMTGVVRWQLIGHGEPNALAFNHAGTLLGATTNLGTTVWDLSSRTALFSLSDPDSDRTLAFTPTGGLLIVGTGHAYTEVLAAETGQIIGLLRPPASEDPTDLVDPIALAGHTLVVGTDDSPPTRGSTASLTSGTPQLEDAAYLGQCDGVLLLRRGSESRTGNASPSASTTAPAASRAIRLGRRRSRRRVLRIRWPDRSGQHHCLQPQRGPCRRCR